MMDSFTQNEVEEVIGMPECLYDQDILYHKLTPSTMTLVDSSGKGSLQRSRENEKMMPQKYPIFLTHNLSDIS